MATASAKRVDAAPILLDPVFEDSAVRFMLDDIGIDPLDPASQKNLRLYIDTVKNVESSGGKNTVAKKQKSGRPGARGDFQWFPQRFQEDLNAAILFHSKAGSTIPDWIKDAKKHGDPLKLNSTQQEQLFLLSLYRFPGTNAQIKEISEGNLDQGRDLYQERWHGGKPESEGGTLSESEWNSHQAQVNKYFGPAIEEATKVKPVEAADPIKERMAKRQIESIADYDSILQEAMPTSIGEENQKKPTAELDEIEVTAQRKEQELFPIQPTGERKEQELFPIQPTGERKEQELFPIQPTGERREQTPDIETADVDVYDLITNPNSVIQEGAQNFYTDWMNKWGDVPVEELPQEEAVKMAGLFFNSYIDTPVDEIPENIRPIVMQTLIQVAAEDTKGTYEQWANSIPKPTNTSEAAVYSLLNAIPFYNPTQETVSQMGYMAGSSLKGNLLDRNTLQEEFNYRVRREQADAGIVTAPELIGAVTDPVGVVGGAFTKGLVAAGKLPVTPALIAGGGAEGGGFGALMPVYPEFGDSRLLNTGVGIGFGVGLTSALMSPAIAADATRAAARKAVIVPPRQQTGPLEGSPVSTFDTRVQGEVEEILDEISPRNQQPSVEQPTQPTATGGTTQPTPVSYNVKPFVNRVSKTVSPTEARSVVLSSNTTIRVLDEQIKQLENKAATVNRRKRKPLDAKINELKTVREKRIDVIDSKVSTNNRQIERLNNVVEESVKNPSVSGAIPRAIRAKRRALELEKENVLHLTNGNAIVDWADPVQVKAFRTFSDSANYKYTRPPEPTITGNKVEDAIAQVNYTISTGRVKDTVEAPVEKDFIGFEPRESLSSAGVRPSVQYAADLADQGYGPSSTPGFDVSPSTARRVYNRDPEAFSGVAPELRTKEQMGREILNEEATAVQRAITQGELAGYSPEEVASDMVNFTYRVEGGWDNLEKLAAKIREEDINQGYNSMVDFVMDPANTTKLMSGEFTEALQPLWIMAENRRMQYGSRMLDLQQQGLVNSEAYVQATGEYLLATKISDVYKAIGSARGRALNQLKKTKQLMQANARKTAKGVIIDNLLELNVANPVMTEACAQAAIRMISFQEQMAQNGVSPATISELISSGVVIGDKRPITTKLLVAATVLLPNSLLASSGMLVANALSASAQILLRGTRETVKGTVAGARTGDFTNLKAHYRATLGLLAGGGSDAQVYRNAARFMYSTFVEGRASDINFNVASIARDQGLKKSDVIKAAKNLLWTRFSEQNKLTADTPDIKQIEKAFKASFNTEGSIEIDKAAQDLFASSYDFSPKHAIFHDPGSVGKVNSIAKAIDFALTVPSRLAVGVDETAKVFFRHQMISEQLYVDAIKANKTDPSKSVGEYYQEYSQELYGEFWNGYNSIPKGPYKNRYHNITKGLRMLEGKFDSMFLERGVSFNDLREQALQMTFQNQTSAFVKNEDRSYKVSDEGDFIRRPSLTDNIARAKNKTGPTSSLGEKVIAVGASGLAPFVKTPVNIVIEGLSYFPLAAPLLFNKSMRQKLRARGYDTEDMLVRSAMGFTVLSSLFVWMSEDDGTGMPKMSGIPVSYDERERWRLAGIPEQSIRIGDTWVPYGRVEPVAGLLAGLANARYHLYNGNEKEFDDVLISTVWGLTADKTYVGAIDFLDNFAYGSPSEGVQKAMNDYVKSYVPTVSADIARAGDSERVALTSVEKIQQRIPGLRQELAPDYASIAEADKQVKGWEVFLKMKFPEASWTNLQREIYKTGVDINKPNRMFQGVELNSKELSLLRKVSQDKVTHTLSWLIETDYYKSLPAKERGPVLKENVNSIRAALGPTYFKEASKRENFGSTYFAGFMARKRNVKVKKGGQEGRKGLLEEPEYSPTK